MSERLSETVAEPGGVPARSRRRVAPFVSLAVAAVAAVLFVLLASGKADKPDATSSFLTGRPAPTVRTATIDGKPFDLSRRKGSWVVLNFFQSTCLPCKAEHPELVAFAEQQAGIADGAELYTVVWHESPDAVTRWFAEHGGSWPIITDDDGKISTDFGVAQVPETWVIDPNGTVVNRYPGVITAVGLSTDLQQLRQRFG